MEVRFWVPDWFVQGSIIPASVVATLELPVLLMHFSSLDPVNLYPTNAILSLSGGFAIMFIVLLSAGVSLLVREPGRAIRILALSQIMSFSLAVVPLFVYPNMFQGRVGGYLCFSTGCQYFNDLLLGGVLAYFVGFAILTFILAIVIGGVGAIVAELIFERADHSPSSIVP